MGMDIARYRDQGWCKILGRCKDMARYRGQGCKILGKCKSMDGCRSLGGRGM